jgi:serine phosphatase RsbU (regulator of sigma subunit)/anti-sigma regulatory factor (Ser/Thr protein kinase)/tetratricopeptide (TPR) repeat protein/transposase
MLRRVEKQEIRVPAHIDYLSDLREFVTQIGHKNGFSDKLINAFKLAVDEAATNIIRHAYRDGEGLITIRAFVKSNSLTLSIIDQGTYFDPKRVKDPDLNRYINIGKKGGLGIFIMRKLMDVIDYRKTEEGNELRITKHDDAAQAKKLISSVSTIPFSIKAKYFTRTIGVISLVIAVTYLYFFLKTDDIVTNQFLSSASFTNSQILNRINSDRPDVKFVDEVFHPVYNDFKEQIIQLTVDDTSGIVQYSSNIGDELQPYKRPANHEQVDRGIYRYELDKSGPVYEFTSRIVINDTGELYGNAYVIFAFENTAALISETRWGNFKLAFFIFVISNFGVALLLYLVMNPLRKLSDWVKNLGQGELEDEIEIQGGTEIGEIAQAFSGITQKLRESQKNLADQERLKKEMKVAQEIQQTLLPMEFPEVDGYAISSYYEAAKEVGGDYYDFVEVDKDTLGIAVADVSGKGVPGSLVMTMIRTALRTEARGIKDAAKVLSRVNAFVSKDIKKGMFVTVFYLILDSRRRSINYASAGHNPMILFRPSTQKTYYLNPKGFPIGVQLPEKDFFDNYIESDTINLTKDDVLLVYTDGITEAMNSRRELFGEERLQDVLRNNGHLGIDDFVERLKNGIYSFTEGAPQYDDITLVAVKEESTREEDELRRAREAHLLVQDGTSIREACEIVNLSTYAYYNKYKKVFEEEGIDAFEITEETSVEAKHLSIEDKTKLFDVIRNHPEFGASRLKDELNVERYGYCELSESQIYDELVRSRLNTRALREAFIQRAKISKARLKPPGTPMMTLDGEVIIHKDVTSEFTPYAEPNVKPPIESEFPEIPGHEPVAEEPSMLRDETGSEGEDYSGTETEEAHALLDTPLEDVLSKEKTGEKQEEIDRLPAAEAVDESLIGDGLEDSEQSTHASIGEIIAESYITEIEDDDNVAADMESAAPLSSDDEEVEEDDNSQIGEFSLQELIGDGFSGGDVSSDAYDEEFEDADGVVEQTVEPESHENIGKQTAKAGASPETDIAVGEPSEETDEAEVREEEEIDPFAVAETDFEKEEEEAETDLTTSSIEELLAADSFSQNGPYAADDGDAEEDGPEDGVEELFAAESFSQNDAYAADDGDAQEAVSEDGIEVDEELLEESRELFQDAADRDLKLKEEGMVSFSDLIQAIDDQIVYVKDMNHQKNSYGGETFADDFDEETVDEQHEEPENNMEPNVAQPSKENLLLNGIQYYKSNDYERAITEFKKIIEFFPKYKEAHSILGNAYFRNKMYEEAASAYETVKQLDPDDITAYENMGVIYANQGEFEDAVREWQKVLELSPDRGDIEDKIKKVQSLE